MTTDIGIPAEHRAGPREWLGPAVLALPLLVLALDVSLLYLAAPHLAARLAAHRHPTAVDPRGVRIRHHRVLDHDGVTG